MAQKVPTPVLLPKRTKNGASWERSDHVLTCNLWASLKTEDLYPWCDKYTITQVWCAPVRWEFHKTSFVFVALLLRNISAVAGKPLTRINLAGLQFLSFSFQRLSHSFQLWYYMTRWVRCIKCYSDSGAYSVTQLSLKTGNVTYLAPGIFHMRIILHLWRLRP